MLGITEGRGIGVAVIHISHTRGHLSELSFPSVITIFSKAVLADQAVALGCAEVAESISNMEGGGGQIAYPVIAFIKLYVSDCRILRNTLLYQCSGSLCLQFVGRGDVNRIQVTYYT